jgi:DNA-binding IclR family transcriptional regulator
MLHRRPQTVSELSQRCDLPLSICSQYLRLIQARGLSRAIRDGRWVRYELHADPSVTGSVEILSALKREMSDRGVAFDALVAAATACTHPRRIALLALLGNAGPLTTDELQARSGMSSAALFRHLAKLAARGFVRWHGGVVELGSPPGAFASALLAAASRRHP